MVDPAPEPDTLSVMQIHRINAFPTVQEGVQIVTARSARGFARHTHDQFGIGLVDEGAQTSASGRGQVEVSAGDLITVNPGEVHDGLPVDDAGRTWRMIYFDPAAMGRLSGCTQEIAFPVRRTPVLAASFRRLFMSLQDSSFSLETETELSILRSSLDDRPASPRKAASVSRAIERLRDDPAELVTLSQLSGLCGLSRFHFLRCFSKATGLTPHAFRVQTRLHLARRLIMTGRPLAAVAAEAGFADQSHLTRLFARSYGMTPGRFARNFVQDRGRPIRG